MKKFIKNLIIYIAIICLITTTINVLYLYIESSSTCGTMGSVKNDSAIIKDVPENIKVCAFGNSHAYYAFDFENLQNEYTCYNFSLPSQSMYYNASILKNYKNNFSNDAVIFICISYSSLFGESEEYLPDFDSKNKRYYKFLENEYIKDYDIKTDLYVNYFPALTGFPDNIKKLFETKNENYWNMETNAEETSNHAYKRYQLHVADNVDKNGNRIYNNSEIDSLYEMIAYCKEINVIPILITPPYLSEYPAEIKKNDSTFFNDYYTLVNKITSDTKVPYYDYSLDTRFCNDYSLFFNSDHINHKGAKKFTNIVNEEIISLYN